jgi:hypothetical protein
VFAAWLRDDGRLHGNRFGAGAGWMGDAPLQPVDAPAYSFDLAADGAGTFFAAWTQAEGNRVDLWARSNASGGGFDAGTTLEQSAGSVRGAPSIAAALGNATAAWVQADGVTDSVAAAQFTPAEGWAAARFIEAEAFHPAAAPRVAVDASGVPIVVWQQDDGFLDSIWANRMADGLEPLSLALSAPAEGLVTNEPTVLVAGSATPGASVHVNGAAVDVDAAGAWALRLALVEGSNRLEAAARDAAGNEVIAVVNVTFIDPRVFVEENLTAAAAALGQVMADLNQTAAALAQTQGALALETANASAAAATLAGVRADLEEVGQRLDMTAAQLADAAGALNATRDLYLAALDLLNRTLEDLAAAEARVAGLEGRMDASEAEANRTASALGAAAARMEGLERQLAEANTRLNETQARLAASNASAVPGGGAPDGTVAVALAGAALVVAGLSALMAARKRRPPAGD